MLLKTNKKFWLISTIIVITTTLFSFVMLTNKTPKQKKVVGNKVINHPQVIELTNLNIIKEKTKNNEKIILYIGHSLCGDCGEFYNKPFQTILDNNKDLKFYYVDFVSRHNLEGDWNEIIGQKNTDDSDQVFYSQVIKGLAFRYTPTLVFINNGQAQFIFDGYGGGKGYQTRYFRTDESKQELGNQNVIDDVQNIINKWK